MRLVTHSCSNTEIVCALGCAGQIVGCDDDSDYPPEITGPLPKIGRDLDVNVEAVVALRPDLVIASDTVPGHTKVIAQMREAGLPVLVLAPRKLADVIDNVVEVGSALNVQDRAAALAEEMRVGLRACPASAQPPRILVEWWPKPLIVPGRQSWVTDLLERAGACNPWSDRDCESLPIEWEEGRRAAPDAIVISWCGVREENYRPDVVRRRPGWSEVPAVRDQRIFLISEAYLGRPGPRLVLGLELLRNITQLCEQSRPEESGITGA